MLGAVSRLIAAMIPGAMPFESISGRAHRSEWDDLVIWIDGFLGKGHCFEQHEWENRVRSLV